MKKKNSVKKLKKLILRIQKLKKAQKERINPIKNLIIKKEREGTTIETIIETIEITIETIIEMIGITIEIMKLIKKIINEKIMIMILKVL